MAAILREPGVAGVDDHPGETRVHRQHRHTAAEIGGSTGVVERTEGCQEFERFRPACRVGRGEEGQGCRVDDCSASEVEATGAMSSSEMAGGAWGAGRVFGLRPESDRNAGPQTAGAPGRWSADARLQLTVCRPLIGSGVEPSRAFEPAVDDGGNAVDGEGGFGNVGRKNDSLARATARPAQPTASCREGARRSVGTEDGGQFPFDRADLTDPQQEDEYVTRSSKRLATARTTAGARALCASWAAERLDRIGAAALDTTSAS